MTPSIPALFAATFAALYAGHLIGDLWAQTEAQATRKHLPGWPGRAACARHAATLTAVLAVALAAVAWVTSARVSVPAAAIGLAVNAATHYWADRRSTLGSLAARVGKGGLYRLGQPREGHDDNPTLGTGAFQLDQAWHVAWLLITALIIAGGSR